jgi:hypothetical protein
MRAAARVNGWSRRLLVVATVSAIAGTGTLGAQEARPAELRSWLAPRLATAPLTISGDVTSCTLVRCNQAASLFATTRVPFGRGLEVMTGLRMSDIGSAQLGGRTALGSVYLGFDPGPLSMWAGATTGGIRSADGITPDPAPGFESGLSLRWRRVGVAVSAAGGHLLMPAAKGRSSAPIIRIVSDTFGLRADTIYPPTADSIGTSDNRWSSTEARVTWRQERWWVTARAGRLASTRQATGFWAGLQAGADLTHGVSLLLGAGKASRSLLDTGDRSTTPHVSVGFGFNTALLSPHERPHDSSGGTATASAFQISNLGDGRYRITVRMSAGRMVEIACDCEGWKPQTMIRAGDVWSLVMNATPGVHHVSIRVDGGGWISPPGLAAIDDDFAGRAGLLVVP